MRMAQTTLEGEDLMSLGVKGLHRAVRPLRKL